MGVSAMQEVIRRMMTDRDFRFEAQNEPWRALAGAKLTEEEVDAIARRDLFKLEELGLEPWTARWVASLR